jgi:cathepsin A (carboxypeptidase C)
MGNKAWTLDLEWSGKEEFVASNDTEWYSERAGRQGGLLRKTTDNRFAFLRVFGAGHMAPYDQPESTLDMLQQWIDGTLE